MDTSRDSLPAPEALVAWFLAHRRELPWRTRPGTPRDPWATLLSEVMSQQTRLEVVVPRVRTWLGRWPDPAALAKASEDEVLAAWAGLGYYSRARNLLRTARAIAREGWPRDARALERLPGVGPYTAAAVASLAFGEQVAMVDGNVLRVLARVHALDGDLRAGSGAKRLSALAEDWIGGGDAGLVNEATMELGALVCIPRRPRCDACPLVGICRAAARGEPERFPVARARRETVELASRVAVVVRDGAVLLRRAEADELLAGHWTLPTAGSLPDAWTRDGRMTGTVHHAITHHRISWEVLRCDPTAPGRAPRGMEWCPEDRLADRLVSSLPRKALAKAGIAVG